MYIYPHNPNWMFDYQLESQLIYDCYGDELKLQHIGSTSIHGLHAKDCIDILGEVSNLSAVEEKKQGLINIGFNAKGAYGIPGREYFSKADRKVHLHIFETGDVNIFRHLNFVKKMQGNIQLINELNALKYKLQEKYPNDKESYQKEKSFFYQKFH